MERTLRDETSIGKRDRIVKRRKRSSRRRQITYTLLVAILFMIAVGPFVYRMDRLRQAKSDYDVPKLQEELLWVEKYGGPLNKLDFTRETKLWLELNLGIKDVERKLISSQDEKHQFWLATYYLQEGNFSKAQNLLEIMIPSPRSELGKGFLSLAKGEAQQTRELLAEKAADWKSMTRQEQCLRHLILAQAAIIMEDILSSKAELEVAQQLGPNNPACLSVGFDMALVQGQWTKALELSRLIDEQPWRPQNSLYQTKKAILLIHENNIQGLSDSLTSLKVLPQGDAYITYVNGINALNKGQLQEGKRLLELALKSGLEGKVQADAQKALEQVSERQNADQVLRSL